MTNVHADSKLKRSEDVTYQLVAGEAILIRMSTGTYFSLNPIGTEFWNMLDGGQTIGQQAEAIADQYNTKVEALANELGALAETLTAEQANAHKAASDLRELAAGIPARYQVAEPPVVNDVLETAKQVEGNNQAGAQAAADLIRDLARTVSRRYHVDSALVRDDLLALADKMASAHLVDLV